MLYKHWRDNLLYKKSLSFNQIRKNIIIAAHLAPSSHNTQPWLFKITDHAIEVRGNPTRRLFEADPTDREFHISLGCAIQNALIAAMHYRYKPHLTLFPSTDKYHIATIKLTKTNNPKNSDLFPFIQQRLTNRSLYQKSRSIPDQFSKEVNELTKDLSAQLKLFTENTIINTLADLTKQGIYTALSNPKFTAELSDLIRHPWTKIGYGMTTNTMGIPDEFSFIAPALITSADMAKSTSQSEWKMVNSAPAIGIIYAPDDTKKSWVTSGMFYQLTALIATKHRFATALLSAAIEIPTQRKKLSKITKIKYPMLFMRLGYPTKKFPHSQRSALNQIIISNHE